MIASKTKYYLKKEKVSQCCLHKFAPILHVQKNKKKMNYLVPLCKSM